MRKLVAAFAVAALAIATLAGCGSKETGTKTAENTITVTDTKGTKEVPVDVKKAVVFELSVLDTIDALGIDVELGLPSGLPSYLSSYEAEAANVGSMKEADMEAIYEFTPDVIFISGRLESYYDELSKIAPTVYIQTNADTYIDDVTANIKMVAEIFGKSTEADEQLTALVKKVEETKAAAESSNEKGLIVLANEGSLSAYGKGSRYGFIHDTLQVKCADENIEVSTHGQEASYEFISKTNPDILFVIDRTAAVGGSVNASETLNNELVNGTNAAKNNKIVTLDSEIWYLSGGGLNSTMKMVEEVAAVFAN